MSRKGLIRTDPTGFKLLSLISNRDLSFWCSCNKKAHIKTLGKIAVGGPVREAAYLIDRSDKTALEQGLRESFCRLPLEPIHSLIQACSVDPLAVAR